MLKKMLIGSAILGAGTVTVLGTSALSYVRTGVNSIRQEVKNQILLRWRSAMPRHDRTY